MSILNINGVKLGYRELGSSNKPPIEAALATINRSDISNQIQAIKVPTLVIAGKEDASPSPAESEMIISRIPNARLALTDQTNHMVVIEKPQVVSN